MVKHGTVKLRGKATVTELYCFFNLNFRGQCPKPNPSQTETTQNNLSAPRGAYFLAIKHVMISSSFLKRSECSNLRPRGPTLGFGARATPLAFAAGVVLLKVTYDFLI